MSPYTEESWEREARQDRATDNWLEDDILGPTRDDMTVDTDGTCERCEACGTFTGNQWGLCTKCSWHTDDYDDTGLWS